MEETCPCFAVVIMSAIEAVEALWSAPLRGWRLSGEGEPVCGVQVRLSREEMKRLRKELLRAKEEVQRALAVEAECVSRPPRNRESLGLPARSTATWCSCAGAGGGRRSSWGAIIQPSTWSSV